MIEIFGIQVEGFFLVPVFGIIAFGAWNIIRPILLKVVATKRALKRKMFERNLVLCLADKGHMHIYQKQSNIVVTDLVTLCGKPFWFDTKSEPYRYDKITCPSCKKLMTESSLSHPIWDT